MKYLITLLFLVAATVVAAPNPDSSFREVRFGLGLSWISLTHDSTPQGWGLEMRVTWRSLVNFFLGGGNFTEERWWGETQYRVNWAILGLEFYPFGFGPEWVKFRTGAGLVFVPEREQRDPIYPFGTLLLEVPTGKRLSWFIQGRWGFEVKNIIFGALF